MLNTVHFDPWQRSLFVPPVSSANTKEKGPLLAGKTDRPYVLRLVRHETEAWNNKFKGRNNTTSLQIIKFHHFPCISVCFIGRFPLWFLRTRRSISSRRFHSITDSFRFFKDSADTCEWRLPLKHVLLVQSSLRCRRESQWMRQF